MQAKRINSSLIYATWPIKKVLAFSTTVAHPFNHNEKHAKAYGQFNLGLHVGDDFHQVIENRQALLSLLPKHVNIQWLEQIHSTSVTTIGRHSPQPILGDALITQEKNIALAVMTADCLPILLYDPHSEKIAAIHAGWRGLAHGIVKNTFDKISTTGSVYAYLGPCIGSKVFEVGKEVKEAFSHILDYEKAFVGQGQGKYLCDLQFLAIKALEMLGVKHIYSNDECTFLNADKYYSYRKNSVTGRMATVICLLAQS